MLCLFQCQSDSALTRTYWSSRGTAGRNSRFKLFLLLILGAFSFVLSAILNSQASYRCTLVPRLPFPVPRSPFPVPRSPFPVPRSPFPVLVTSPPASTHALIASQSRKSRHLLFSHFMLSSNTLLVPRGPNPRRARASYKGSSGIRGQHLP